MKIADQLKLIGVLPTANQVRGVWLRRGLVKRYDWLLWLEREAAGVGRSRRAWRSSWRATNATT